MDVGAAQIFGAVDLARRRLHQRRAAEEDRALVAHDDRLVRHRRHIGAARGAGSHDHGDLRDAARRHGRLVEEDAAEMLAVGEDLVLVRQVRAARIDEIDAGQVVLLGDLLRAQMLLHGHRIVGAALDRRVVGDDDAFAAGNAADAGDDAGRARWSRHTCRGRRAAKARETACRDRAAARCGRAPEACRAPYASRARARRRPWRSRRSDRAGPRPARAWRPHCPGRLPTCYRWQCSVQPRVHPSPNPLVIGPYARRCAGRAPVAA